MENSINLTNSTQITDMHIDTLILGDDASPFESFYGSVLAKALIFVQCYVRNCLK